MKEIKEVRKVKKDEEKVFTKRKGKDIIKKNYNPFKVNVRLIYKRRDGLYYMEKEILKEIKRDMNFKERIVININKKTFIKVFNKARIGIINKLME